MLFTYASNGDANGLFYWIGTNYGAGAWENPVTAGRLSIVPSSTLGGTVASIVNRDASLFHTNNDGSSNGIRLDLGAAVTLRMTGFAFRNRSDDPNTIPSALEIDGSPDNLNWYLVGAMSHDSTQDAWEYHATPGQTSFYRYFFIKATSNNNNFGYFTVGEVELYGETPGAVAGVGGMFLVF